jgi:uncharacterized protein (DUF1810 family)
MRDEYDLKRFIALQEPVYADAVAILRGGSMCTSYMRFIFPRLVDMGEAAAEPLAIASLDEARAYLAFPVLGNRYRECVDALSWLGGTTPEEVFGNMDARRLHASLTLFSEATNEQLLRLVLGTWFGNRVDEDTIVRLDLAA